MIASELSNSLLLDLIRVVTIGASLCASFRILTYRRDGRFKRGISFMAWALAFFLLSQAITVALVPSASPSLSSAGISVIIMLSVLKSRGNVANFLRSD